MESAIPSPPDLTRIVQDPAVLGGKPTVRGTRIPVAVVLQHLAENPDLGELFAAYPRLTLEDLRACLAYGQRLIEHQPRIRAAAHSA